MYVIVIGLGQVGQHLLATLELEQHDIVAIDQSAAAVRQVSETHDVMTMLGYGASEKVLREAGAERADLVVAVTNHDEVNLISALAARRMGAKRAIARVQDDAWASMSDGVEYGMLGVDVVVNPRILIAEEIAKIARSHGAIEVITLANERIELVEMELTQACRMLHKPLADLHLPAQCLVAAVVREGGLFVPGGADVLLPGDRIYLLGRPDHMLEAEDAFTQQREAHRVCIVGGGVVGQALARELLADKSEVLVIELDHDRARALAENLPGVTVVEGDGTDLQQLKNEEINAFDLFAAVTHEDEVNLMAALLAKRVGAARTLCLVHRPDYREIYSQLGIDIVLSPRIVASEHILRFCREAELRSLTVLEDGQAEVLEMTVGEGSRLVGQAVRRMNFPRGALLAAILHREQVIIPRGDDVVRADDTVIVLTTTAARPAVVRLLRPRVL